MFKLDGNQQHSTVNKQQTPPDNQPFSDLNLFLYISIKFHSSLILRLKNCTFAVDFL